MASSAFFTRFTSTWVSWSRSTRATTPVWSVGRIWMPVGGVAYSASTLCASSPRSTGASCGLGIRAKWLNSSTMRRSRSTSSSTTPALSLNMSWKRGCFASCAAWSVSSDMRMGVSGFLISCASRRATSCHAAMRSLAISRSVVAFSSDVMRLNVRTSSPTSPLAFTVTWDSSAPSATRRAPSVRASTGRVIHRDTSRPSSTAKVPPSAASRRKARMTPCSASRAAARLKTSRTVAASPSGSAFVTVGGSAVPALARGVSPASSVTCVWVRRARCCARLSSSSTPPTAHSRRSPKSTGRAVTSAGS